MSSASQKRKTFFSFRWLLGLLAIVAAFFVLPKIVAINGPAGPVSQGPNIVLVYADDVDCETVFGTFPQQEIASMRFENLKALAADGIRFSNFHVTTPVCGPSRACLYSGQYAHRNGCRVNNPSSLRAIGFDGGYKTFDPDNELAIWMKQAGYQTAHVGKYLHSDFIPDHERGVSWKELIPKGWDHFRLSLGGNYFGFASYVKSTNESSKPEGDEYRTDWDIRNAIDVLKSHSTGPQRHKPLMLCWSPIAAHITGEGIPMVAPRHKSLYQDAEIPELESRLDQTVSGQISELESMPMPGAKRKQHLTDVYRDRLRAIKSIDEGIGALRAELKKLGMLENTIFIFTSDHGYRFAQHRHYGKRLPYDRITKVPFIVSGCGVPKNQECSELLANIDIAPTLVELAEGRTPDSCDGRSFANLLRDPEGESLDREAIVIENWGEAVTEDVVFPATYSSIRMQDSIYTEWASGGVEYYDLQDDPEQLNNLYESLEAERQLELAAKLRQLRGSDLPPMIAKTSCLQLDVSTRLCGSIKPIEIFGMVEADAGTEKVELEFRSTDSGEYWSENGWTSSPYRWPAKLLQPNGLTSAWTFSLDTNSYAKETDAVLDPRNVQLTSIVTDLQGRQSSQESLAFEMSFEDPNTSIASHSESKDGQRLTIRGNATGLKTLSTVRVGLLDAKTRQYWNGQLWQKEFCYLTAEFDDQESSVPNQRQWQLTTAKPDSSQLLLVARAYGPKRQYDHTPAVETIDLKD